MLKSITANDTSIMMESKAFLHVASPFGLGSLMLKGSVKTIFLVETALSRSQAILKTLHTAIYKRSLSTSGQSSDPDDFSDLLLLAIFGRLSTEIAL
jgi:hypothetical protein